METVERVDYGDPLAPPGTAAWAKRWALEAVAKIPRIELEPMNVLSHIEFGAKHHAWEMLRGPDGKTFVSFDAFCEAPKPYGCEFPAAKVRRVLAAIDGSSGRVFGATAGKAPSPTAGPGRGKRKTVDDGKPFLSKGGNGAEYLAARIARDAPEVHAKMVAGEFQSVRKAALAAGILKPQDPVKAVARALRRVPKERHGEAVSGDLRGAKMVVRGLTREEQSELYEWLGKELAK